MKKLTDEQMKELSELKAKVVLERAEEISGLICINPFNIIVISIMIILIALVIFLVRIK